MPLGLLVTTVLAYWLSPPASRARLGHIVGVQLPACAMRRCPGITANGKQAADGEVYDVVLPRPLGIQLRQQVCHPRLHRLVRTLEQGTSCKSLAAMMLC